MNTETVAELAALAKASSRRDRLAKAVKAWFQSADGDEADIALEALLVEMKVIDAEDIVETIEVHSNGLRDSLLIATDDGYATIIDERGNLMRGKA